MTNEPETDTLSKYARDAARKICNAAKMGGFVKVLDEDGIAIVINNAIERELSALRSEKESLERQVGELREWVDKVGFYFAGTEYDHIAQQALKVLSSLQPARRERE